jgi:hypothetical protein
LPAGWFVLDVMKETARKRRVDIDPEEHCSDYGRRASSSVWVRIPESRDRRFRLGSSRRHDGLAALT